MSAYLNRSFDGACGHDQEGRRQGALQTRAPGLRIAVNHDVLDAVAPHGRWHKYALLIIHVSYIDKNVHIHTYLHLHIHAYFYTYRHICIHARGAPSCRSRKERAPTILLALSRSLPVSNVYVFCVRMCISSDTYPHTYKQTHHTCMHARM